MWQTIFICKHLARASEGSNKRTEWKLCKRINGDRVCDPANSRERVRKEMVTLESEKKVNELYRRSREHNSLKWVKVTLSGYALNNVQHNTHPPLCHSDGNFLRVSVVTLWCIQIESFVAYTNKHFSAKISILAFISWAYETNRENEMKLYSFWCLNYCSIYSPGIIFFFI